MPRKTDKKEISIRSSAAEYLTFVAATGDDKNSVEVRYEDENIWITQKMLATLYEVDFGISSSSRRSRIPAKITNAKAKPNAVETE